MWRPWENSDFIGIRDIAVAEDVLPNPRQNPTDTEEGAEINIEEVEVDEVVSDDATDNQHGQATTKSFLSVGEKKIILNVYENIKESTGKMSAVKLEAKLTNTPYTTVFRIVKNGVEERKVRKDKGIFKQLTEVHADLIRRSIYDFYKEKLAPTISMLHQRLIEQNIVNCCESTLRKFLITIDFSFKKVGKRQVLMESDRLKKWRRKYLEDIQRYRDQNRPIFYLDETWFDTHDTAKKGWADNSGKCILDVPPTKGKRIIILHAGSKNGFVENCLFLGSKNIKDARADYHQEMNSEVFEKWVTTTLLPNLPNI